MILSLEQREYFNRLLSPIHIELESEQPHISGERFLMQKDKLVLVGRMPNDKQVIIKTAHLPLGKNEIRGEKAARDLISTIAFTGEAILLPKELYYGEIDGQLMLITEFIPQEKGFVEYSLEDQFFMALRAFEAQEAFHATTFEHLKRVKKVFPIFSSKEYIDEFNKSKEIITDILPNKDLSLLNTAQVLLADNAHTIDTYANYLAHTDFTPNNFRVHNHKLYMLDTAPEVRTMHFGNKYEGWARFLNYMVIHNPELDRLLCDYIKRKRGDEEYKSLKLMRIYKIVFLIRFYAESLIKVVSNQDLYRLTQERIDFWYSVLGHTLTDSPIPETLIETYKNKRDTLRSDEEKKRLASAGLT